MKTSLADGLKSFILLVVVVVSWPLAAGAATTLDFETLVDLEVVTNQFQLLGLTFSNTVALRAFSADPANTLDDSEFPPFSGITVVANGNQNVLGGSIMLDFTTPVTSVSGHFTYSGALTLTAFDASSAQVAQASSALSENLVSSGNSPNEFIQLTFAGGIAEVTIEISGTDATFTLDDLTFTPLTTEAVPWPANLGLLGAGVLGIAGLRALLLMRVRRTDR